MLLYIISVILLISIFYTNYFSNIKREIWLYALGITGLIYLLKLYLRNSSLMITETFQDPASLIDVTEINDIFNNPGINLDIPVSKVKGLAFESGQIDIANMECKDKVKKLQAQAEYLQNNITEYRKRVKNNFEQYLLKNYIKKDQVEKYVQKISNFKNYDVTKHPDFIKQCINLNPKVAGTIARENDQNNIVEPLQSQSQPQSQPQSQLPEQFNLEECKNKCLKPGFIDIVKHPEYVRAPNITSFKSKDLPDFTESCSKQELFPIEKHNRYPELKNQITELNIARDSLNKEIGQLKSKNNELKKKELELSNDNKNYKSSLKECLKNIGTVSTISDCPSLTKIVQALNLSA